MKRFGANRAGRAARSRARPSLERLEARELLASADYVLSGFRWANPDRITYSIAPDGVYWDQGMNDLTAALNARFGPWAWRREVARALQTWASVADINIVQHGDSRLAFDATGWPQGDRRFGDIRVGGFSFNDPNTLGQAYSPPPNGSTAAGDAEFNTQVDWSIGGDGTDLFTVMLHEFGHSLGLEHSPDPNAVMYASYNGPKTGLGAADIAGIQAIYGPRMPDAYQSRGLGTSFANANAIAVPATTNPPGVTLKGLELPTIGATEYFQVVAPAVLGARLQVRAIANGVSLLSPRITIYDPATHAPLASGGNASLFGDNPSARVDNVQPGRNYVIAVTGATADVFAVGGYQLQVQFLGGTPLAVRHPTTPRPHAASITALTALVPAPTSLANRLERDVPRPVSVSSPSPLAGRRATLVSSWPGGPGGSWWRLDASRTLLGV